MSVLLCVLGWLRFNPTAWLANYLAKVEKNVNFFHFFSALLCFVAKVEWKQVELKWVKPRTQCWVGHIWLQQIKNCSASYCETDAGVKMWVRLSVRVYVDDLTVRNDRYLNVNMFPYIISFIFMLFCIIFFKRFIKMF